MAINRNQCGSSPDFFFANLPSHVVFASPNNILVPGMKNIRVGTSVAKRHTITGRHSTLHHNDLLALPCMQNRHTGIPAMGDPGSKGIGLTVSFAPMTRVRSVLLKSSLISSISRTISLGTEASASSTFHCPGIRPATEWMKNRTLIPFALSVCLISAIGY